ncbi:MAG: hypothetical protein KAQ85_01465 [Thermodesulfovibrionia bacterium]|nr:hypothetical protein [Thermodesulfovibrionia bacterium]
MKKDEKGRITQFNPNRMTIKNGESISGHSVCNDCGKDMPVCWDVVCSKCGKTFCYGCSVTKDDKWFCNKCK